MAEGKYSELVEDGKYLIAIYRTTSVSEILVTKVTKKCYKISTLNGRLGAGEASWIEKEHFHNTYNIIEKLD